MDVVKLSVVFNNKVFIHDIETLTHHCIGHVKHKELLLVSTEQ